MQRKWNKEKIEIVSELAFNSNSHYIETFPPKKAIALDGTRTHVAQVRGERCAAVSVRVRLLQASDDRQTFPRINGGCARECETKARPSALVAGTHHHPAPPYVTYCKV